MPVIPGAVDGVPVVAGLLMAGFTGSMAPEVPVEPAVPLAPDVEVPVLPVVPLVPGAPVPVVPTPAVPGAVVPVWVGVLAVLPMVLAGEALSAVAAVVSVALCVERLVVLFLVLLALLFLAAGLLVCSVVWTVVSVVVLAVCAWADMAPHNATATEALKRRFNNWFVCMWFS